MAVKGDPHVLTVAGSDSSGGAGIARDIETIAAFGLRTCLALTAITVQTHQAVEQVLHLEPALVAAQMRAALESNEVAAVKIGMLGTGAVIEAVASLLRQHPSVPAVLDPVLAASSGAMLARRGTVEALRRDLMPLCQLTTPNLPELAMLAGAPEAEDEDMILAQAQSLLDAGASAVLVKGGHARGDRCIDVLIRRNAAPVRFKAPRLGAEMRGTGCMLASAIAAGLALGRPLEECVPIAKRHVLGRLQQLRSDDNAVSVGTHTQPRSPRRRPQTASDPNGDSEGDECGRQ